MKDPVLLVMMSEKYVCSRPKKFVPACSTTSAEYCVGGGYATIGNLPLTLQNQLKNIIPLLMVPPGGNVRQSFEVLVFETCMLF